MRPHVLFFLVVLLLSSASSPAQEGSAPGRGFPGTPRSFSATRLHNCEVEISMIKKRIETQEEARDSLERELRQIMRGVKESSSETARNSIDTVKASQARLEKLVLDCKEIKKHVNSLSKTVGELSKALGQLEERCESQRKSTDSIQKAMRSLTLALKAQGGATPDSGEIYTVRSGDSLEKIAKRQKTTVKALKEHNNLRSDTILAGQKLLIPQTP